MAVEQSMADQDTEITLGTGKIFFIFFGLVILCGIFFGAGYMVGKSASASAPTAQSGNTELTPQSVAAKPSSASVAQQKSGTENCSTPDGCSETSPDQLTFYKAVEQKTPDAQLTPVRPPSAQNASAEDKSVTSSGGYVVQVAAVSKQQDAEALVAALRQKQYAVSVVSTTTDKLYHVQAGPFSDMKEADAIRSRLVSDGYNPIVKR